MLERVPKYTLRKLSVGLASVMIGSGILMNSPKVLADTTDSNEGTSPVVQEDKNKTSGATQEATVQESRVAETATGNKNESENELELAKASGGAPASATTTNAEEKVVATNPRDTTQDKDKQTNANETKQNTTDVGKKDTEVTPDTQKTTAKFKVLAARPVMKVAGTAETPDPTVPDKSANAAIINNQDELANDWMQLKQGKLKLYLTVRGLDNKTYVSSYADAQKKLSQ